MTDTQTKAMVGAYGHPQMDTPNLDRLAREGIRFERAYTTSPLCTSARSALFTGLHSQVNGAWCNHIAPGRGVAMMGEIFRYYGYRAGYTGKWHLDGTTYAGTGIPGGGFEPDWWYDGLRYVQDIGPERFQAYRSCRTPADLRRAGVVEGDLWGPRVADRAIDFLGSVKGEPFVLVVSFEEPHAPALAPPEYWERFASIGLRARPNRAASTASKPRLMQIQREERGELGTPPQGLVFFPEFFGCNSFIDRQIGRVIDAVDQLHPDDTTIIYTTDHGDLLNSHGLIGKGPMMYEESCNIPLIIRRPGGPQGAVSDALASHVDLLPTMLDLCGLAQPPILQGRSLGPVLVDPTARVRDYTLLEFHRYAINNDSFGEFYPVRCVVDTQYKLVINLFETDELYDLRNDPYEMNNCLGDPRLADARDRLHDWLLAEMDRIRDPFRSFRWGNRPWRQAREQFYFGGANRERPPGFPFFTD
ncbi:MAG: sulfatase-like hydrolase/transferase [Gammaproteobacteria bacterium]|nr:sulfatase-like hydrolase/transferase [Gammaproteobacteria bacterium]